MIISSKVVIVVGSVCLLAFHKSSKALKVLQTHVFFFVELFWIIELIFFILLKWREQQHLLHMWTNPRIQLLWLMLRCCCLILTHRAWMFHGQCCFIHVNDCPRMQFWVFFRLMMFVLSVSSLWTCRNQSVGILLSRFGGRLLLLFAGLGVFACALSDVVCGNQPECKTDQWKKKTRVLSPSHCRAKIWLKPQTLISTHSFMSFIWVESSFIQ